MPEEQRGPRVAFVTLGCKVNQTESDAIAEALGVFGTRAEAEEAEVIVVNTCTVTGEADHKARKAVRHALALPTEPVVVVTGCLAALDADGLRALDVRVVVEADKARVAPRVQEALEARGVRPQTAQDGRRAFSPRTRAQLKVQDGCDAFCSYCIVPYARGVPSAVPMAELVERAERLVIAGVKEIVLTGINIGRYDDAGARLADVLSAVAATGVPRVRLSSVEPRDVTERLLATAAATPAFCRHFHVPLQSGSTSVLERMGRPYDVTGFADVVRRIRSAFPGVAISTDVIVGFPGETDAEFAETLAFVESQAFSRLHVFRYSARPGTPAAAMSAQIAGDVKSSRSAELRSLGDRLAVVYAAEGAGSTVEVLVERIVDGDDGAVLAEGTTREYLRVRVPLNPADPVAPGELRHVLLLDHHDSSGAVRAMLLGEADGARGHTLSVVKSTGM